MVELLLHNGACGRLLPGWSKTLLKSLEENNLKEIAEAVRPGNSYVLLGLNVTKTF